jgi:predicted nucleotidyltransferase
VTPRGDDMNASTKQSAIIRTIVEHYPEVQAIYLFGSYGTADQWPDSDIDLALLLPPQQASSERPLAMSQCWSDLADSLGREVDVVNIRRVSTVFQKEIIANGRLLYCADQYAVDEFEMLVLSYYQKLNDERREIVNSFIESGRAYAV